MNERRDPNDDQELYEEVPPRSIFAATWFRVVLVVIVLGVIGAVAVPYVLDWMNPPPTRPVASKPPASSLPAPVTPTTPGSGSLPDKPLAQKPFPEKKDPVIPPPAATARPPEPKPLAPKPEPKATASASDSKSRPAMAVTESSKPPAAKPEATPKPATPKPEVVAKAEPKSDPKPAVASKPAPASPKRAATRATPPSPSAASGSWWVQVGAFKDADIAKRLAAKLREDNFAVEETVTRAAGAPAAPKPAANPPTARPTDIGNENYDVFVTGQTPEELNKRLAAKGLAAEASGAGMLVKPSLPLRDAVTLSKDLAIEGFKVQVRRSGGAAAASPPAAASAPAAGEGGSELHRVRVGAFPDRAAAQAAVKQLEAKGYKPYIARGDR